MLHVLAVQITAPSQTVEFGRHGASSVPRCSSERWKANGEPDVCNGRRRGSFGAIRAAAALLGQWESLTPRDFRIWVLAHSRQVWFPLEGMFLKVVSKQCLCSTDMLISATVITCRRWPSLTVLSDFKKRFWLIRSRKYVPNSYIYICQAACNSPPLAGVKTQLQK